MKIMLPAMELSGITATLDDGRRITISGDGYVNVSDSDGNEYELELPTIGEIATKCDGTDNNEIPVMTHHRH